MKAIVKTSPSGGRKGSALRDMPKPEAGFGEVVIKVLACAICGTDKHIYNWDPGIAEMLKPPVIYGHEFCGEIVEAGKNVSSFKKGDYVSSEMHVICGKCSQCRTGRGHICANTCILGVHADGSFAEYVKVPAGNVLSLDEKTVPLKVGAFLDALGNAVHTALEYPITGKHIAVVGYGPIGAMSASIAHFAGAESVHITDVSGFALKHAEEWKGKKKNVFVYDVSGGKSATEEIRRATDGGADYAFEMSGSPRAINDSLRITRNGGAVLLLGIPSEKTVTIENYDRDIVFKGITLKAIIGRKMFDTWFKMLGMLSAGLRVEHIVTHEFEGLENFFDAMDIINSGEALKIVLYPHGKPGKR